MGTPNCGASVVASAAGGSVGAMTAAYKLMPRSECGIGLLLKFDPTFEKVRPRSQMPTALTRPLPSPTSLPAVSAATVAVGPPIPAIVRLKIFSSAEWEDFVLEWAHSLKASYAEVEQ